MNIDTAADNNVIAAENDRHAAPLMLPAVSNGLPPPLWSFVFSWLGRGDAPEVDVICVSAPVVGVLEVSTRRLLESNDAMLDAVETPEVTVVFFIVGELDVLDMYEVQLPDEGSPVHDCGASRHIAPGPTPARNATIRFWPVTPRFPHACMIGEYSDSSP